eukprot:1806296-Rhodomonas_salina.5
MSVPHTVCHTLCSTAHITASACTSIRYVSTGHRVGRQATSALRMSTLLPAGSSILCQYHTSRRSIAA